MDKNKITRITVIHYSNDDYTQVEFFRSNGKFRQFSYMSKTPTKSNLTEYLENKKPTTIMIGRFFISLEYQF